MSDRDLENLEPQEPEIEYAFDWPRDEYYYGIGCTTPPKDYIGAVSLVLVMVLSVTCFVSALSLMNIRLFVQDVESTHETVSISFHSPSDSTLGSNSQNTGFLNAQSSINSAVTNPYTGDTPGLDISISPESVDNTPGQDRVLSWQEVYLKVIPSVVSISCTNGPSSSSGTGVIMHEDGYIITNAHVIEGSSSILVLLNTGESYAAQCVGLDELSDLAVLKIDATGLTAAEFGDSTVLRVGDEVVAIGDPLGIQLRGTMTDGIISGINRDITTGNRTMSVIQTTAALNEGNSGGPLINCYGQVIGINTIKIGDYASYSGVEGLGFAIPTTTVKSVVEQLMANGYVSGRPDLGFDCQTISPFYQTYYRLPSGVIITDVSPGSSACACGISTGDILLRLDGVDITDLNDLESFTFACEVDQQVTATVYRSGREIEFTFTVGEDTGD